MTSLCDSCYGESKQTTALKYCKNCEEHLCNDCADSHVRTKEFKSHDINPLTISTVAKNCSDHLEMPIDYFCIHHDVLCCGKCVSSKHKACQNVMSLELASKDVKSSALLTDIRQEINHLIKVLEQLNNNRQANIISLIKQKTDILQQLGTIKAQILSENIDDLENDSKTELTSLQMKHEAVINNERKGIAKLSARLKESENRIRFLEENGSDNLLFVTLHQQAINLQRFEYKVRDMILNIQEINVTLEESQHMSPEPFWKLVTTTRPCEIQWNDNPRKLQQAQSFIDKSRGIVGFEKEREITLKSGVKYELYGVAVTRDNNLLLSNYQYNHPKLFVYRNCKDFQTEIKFSSRPCGVAVIPETDTAVVTIPDEKSVQFVNTTNFTLDIKVDVEFNSYSITAVKDQIFVGGFSRIKILKTDGSILQSILFPDSRHPIGWRILYNEVTQLITVKTDYNLYCMNQDGTLSLVYSKDEAIRGIAADQQGNIYFTNRTGNINRLSLDWTTTEEVPNKNHGLDTRSGAMSFNRDFTKMFVINKIDDKSVFVYKCIY
ncbi:Hypothetical predicted protein [Mytilus galloprovincialis]|uniref:B box-type domain-containing protein n=1 Tax=Mytilus galloprovincialis TaxID=29158 RepID=A0A8B6DQU1_MYTGA|nr:Hypothetical predicted protein [Mytilus galloprovincialis]